MSGDDRDLCEYFAAVRREEEARVPPISTFLTTRHKYGRGTLPGKLVATAACLATMIAAAAWLLHGSHHSHEGVSPRPELSGASITTWKPATGFLLDTPGRQLFADVPAIGERPGERPTHLIKKVLP